MKALTLRFTENLWSMLKEYSQKNCVSINRVIHLTLTTSLGKKDISFDERINTPEKKEIESRVFFTPSETELLREYASLNGWSLTKEIRYRVISSLSRRPKLNQEDLKAIYAVRSSINVLGANVNRLVRDREPLSDSNIHVCQDLVTLLQELKEKIKYLEKCSSSTFKLKGTRD